MTFPSVRRWLLGSAAVLLLGIGALALVVAARLPDDEEVAARIAAGFSQRYGVELTVGGAHWSLWPVPVLALSELATDQPQPITLRRVSVRLHLWPLLLRREVAIDEIALESLVLPRASVRAFRDKGPEPQESERIVPLPAPWTLAAVPVERVRWRDVVWIDRRDIALAYDGEVTFDDNWRPRNLRLERAGAASPVRLRLDREGSEDRWRTRIDAGGGTWNGQARLEVLPEGRGLRVSAESIRGRSTSRRWCRPSGAARRWRARSRATPRWWPRPARWAR